MIGTALAVFTLLALAVTLFRHAVQAETVATTLLGVVGTLGCLVLACVVFVLGTR